SAERRSEVAERAAESAGAADGALGLSPLVGFTGADIRAGLQQLASKAWNNPRLALKHSAGFLGEVGRVLSGTSTVAPDPKDRRFGDPAWQTNRLYGATLQTYLAWQQSLYAFVDDADLASKDAERARFAVRLLTEALAPTNRILGNPAALKKLIDTGGESLARGLQHLLDDIAHNGGMPSQVDMTAFAVGKNLALSPGAVVFKNDVLELIQYAPATEQVYSRPLLLLPPQINKFYMMDLAPGKSIIEYLVKQGFTVFALSWRNPTPAQRDWGLETYLRAVLEAIDAARDIAASESINMLGACAGGMTLTALLAHLAAIGDRRVNAVTLLVTVLDTSVESQLGLFMTPETIAAAKAISRARGVLSGRDMARVFNWMRPNDLIWNYWVNNYLLGEEPPAFDILYWNNDTTNLPAQLHADLLDIALANPFRNPGALTLLATPLDASKISNDMFILAGITDHITPWQACYATTQILGGRCEFIVSSSGHIQSIVNPPGNPKASFYTNPQLPADPQQWLAGAQKRPGSWWDHWRDWLKERSGELRPAPHALGDERFAPGAPAPGTYMLQR
ncbi:MAG TPA: alpha/beta fold hydrolase, partial [Roseiflexaceae bacterium]|nr:alpha/beta fold hydrolase [Roseiflexaceae bacterium]